MNLDIAQWTLLIGWIFVLLWVPFILYSNRKTHPGALFVLFFTEMWERFSYYGMRALLTLYMTRVLFLGMEQAETKALGIYGAYTAMVYLLPVIGGLIADRIFGFRKAIIFGGVLMSLGHFTLALQGIQGLENNLVIFYLALALIIVGNGYFKPNVTSFLGQFYQIDDPRKDGAFSIFYMGVNVGSFLATMTCGYVGERINWHYGFGLAGIGMALGIIVFVIYSHLFKDKGYPPAPIESRERVVAGLSRNSLIYIGSFLAIPLVALIFNINRELSIILLLTSLLILAYLIYSAVSMKNKKEGQRLLVVTVLFFFHTTFWALFEQAGGSLTLFAARNVDRAIGGAEIPASMFLSLNPFFIMILAPLFSWMWIRLRQSEKEPSTPMKFVLGLSQLALGYVFIVLGARFFVGEDGLVPLVFLVLMYLFHTTGELSLSPVGLSMITKLSPARRVGFVMGAWYLSISLANSLAGAIGKFSAVENLPENPTVFETLNLYTESYMIWGIGAVMGMATLLLLLVPMLRRWMHGIH